MPQAFLVAVRLALVVDSMESVLGCLLTEVAHWVEEPVGAALVAMVDGSDSVDSVAFCLCTNLACVGTVE